MDIVNAYAELGSYRATAALGRTTHKTVKRVVERRLPRRRTRRAGGGCRGHGTPKGYRQ